MGQNISNLTQPFIVIQGTKETCVVLGIEYQAADLVVTQSTTGWLYYLVEIAKYHIYFRARP
jgi:hypothetical protein